jgi:hypothetical protein
MLTVDGIWHTSVVAYDIETYFGHGIQQSIPGKTHHGHPLKVIDLGFTEVPPELFCEFLQEISDSFSHTSYDLFENNCNHFSNEIAQFLVGEEIPKEITSLPQTVLQTPLGQMIRPLLAQAMVPIVTAPTSNPAVMRNAEQR